MTRRRVAALTFAAAILATSAPARAVLPLPPDEIALDTPEGEKLLVGSKARADYFRLSEQFVAQKDQGHCPIAASVMVLNALGVEGPEVKAWGGARGFTQDNFFNDDAKRLSLDRGGLTLAQLEALLTTQPVKVRAVHASDTTIDEFRKAMAANLADPSDYVIVNWLRSKLDQEPKAGLGGAYGGHYSPLGAYDEASDKILVMDVARYKYPPFWVDTAKLFDAMKAVDADSSQARGYLVIGASPDGLAHPPATAPKSKLLVIAGGIAFGLFAVGALLGSVVTRWRMKRAARRA